MSSSLWIYDEEKLTFKQQELKIMKKNLKSFN